MSDRDVELLALDEEEAAAVAAADDAIRAIRADIQTRRQLVLDHVVDKSAAPPPSVSASLEPVPVAPVTPPRAAQATVDYVESGLVRMYMYLKIVCA